MTKTLQTTIVNENDVQIIVDFDATLDYNDVDNPNDEPSSKEMVFSYRIFRVSLVVSTSTIDVTSQFKKDADIMAFVKEQIDIDIHDLYEPRV
jgi:hypothetical protein